MRVRGVEGLRGWWETSRMLSETIPCPSQGKPPPTLCHLPIYLLMPPPSDRISLCYPTLTCSDLSYHCRITHSDVDAGLWLPTRHLSLEWVKFYSRSLENNNTFELTIWPDHGIIGSAGHAVVPELNRAIHMWARHRQKNIQYLKKGMNLRTECFSALRCEVEDPLDAKNTSLNRKFLFALDACDTILVSGQALSHSVNFTMKDLVIHLSTPTKLYLLKDGCSSVQGFEVTIPPRYNINITPYPLTT